MDIRVHPLQGHFSMHNGVCMQRPSELPIDTVLAELTAWMAVHHLIQYPTHRSRMHQPANGQKGQVIQPHVQLLH